MRASWLAIALAVTGCSDVCARNSDCASGLVCTVDGACVVPPGDGGVDGSTATTDADTGVVVDPVRDASAVTVRACDDPGAACTAEPAGAR